MGPLGTVKKPIAVRPALQPLVTFSGALLGGDEGGRDERVVASSPWT
jgi:hypothetical protein